MNHANAYQCLDSIRQHIAFLEKKALDHADKVRELEADKEELRIKYHNLSQPYSQLQVDYAAAETEIDILKATMAAHNKPKLSNVNTTRLYWDCNCEKDYINHSFITHCEICGAHKADQPDSRLEELGMARLAGINELAERYARSNK